MSVAPCFADTNDLALDPATTAEDTQRTLQSILSHTGSLFFFCSLSVSPSVLLPHSSNLSCLSFALPSPLSSEFLIFSLSVTKDAIALCLFYPKHFLYLLSLSLSAPLSHSLPLSIIHSVHLNLFLSVSLFLFPSSTHLLPLLSPSLSAQPTASLSLGRGEQCQPTWGPSAVPAEKAGSTREHP